MNVCSLSPEAHRPIVMGALAGVEPAVLIDELDPIKHDPFEPGRRLVAPHAATAAAPDRAADRRTSGWHRPRAISCAWPTPNVPSSSASPTAGAAATSRLSRRIAFASADDHRCVARAHARTSRCPSNRNTCRCSISRNASPGAPHRDDCRPRPTATTPPTRHPTSPPHQHRHRCRSRAATPSRTPAAVIPPMMTEGCHAVVRCTLHRAPPAGFEPATHGLGNRCSIP